ncbi:uncharacterized protein LY79DRAFT_344246 [Colletotrichum navitas]|uniref:Uncharacterized protein n=1 Tax=Colletotrichum navitas TaxID=681940 RepID=A0AAD8UZP7_9PEZI|nr:uncharacterized protein LY79DRAFT_344246 [Colletotrichum navitas]KAK1579500.1 hypothetical protein LY79DRAFT_344246 [Colletotrichum navitas]
MNFQHAWVVDLQCPMAHGCQRADTHPTRERAEGGRATRGVFFSFVPIPLGTSMHQAFGQDSHGLFPGHSPRDAPSGFVCCCIAITLYFASFLLWKMEKIFTPHRPFPHVLTSVYEPLFVGGRQTGLVVWVSFCPLWIYRRKMKEKISIFLQHLRFSLVRNALPSPPRFVDQHVLDGTYKTLSAPRLHYTVHPRGEVSRDDKLLQRAWA